jgi:alanine racemase
MNSRPIQAILHADALRHNLGVIRKRSGDAKVWAVVKANAYGHGIANVFEGLRGADGFACLDLSEAQLLRSLGWRGPILLLEGAFNIRDLELCSRLNLWHVIHTEAQIDWLAAHKTNEGQRVFLKMNSGMNRLGFTPDAYRAAYARLCQLPQVSEVSHMTHFSDADTDKGCDLQWTRFRRAIDGLDGEVSVSNSAAVLRHADVTVQSDWVRAGIALYGSSVDYPARSVIGWELRPVMQLTSKIIATQVIEDRATKSWESWSALFRSGQELKEHARRNTRAVGYGSSYEILSENEMRIGIVACGYADGYPRHASLQEGGAPVLVDGQRTNTLGRISMDMLTVDLTHLPDAHIGSSVTLWGPDLPVDEIAHAAGTIGYELLCAVAPRVPLMVVE